MSSIHVLNTLNPNKRKVMMFIRKNSNRNLYPRDISNAFGWANSRYTYEVLGGLRDLGLINMIQESGCKKRIELSKEGHFYAEALLNIDLHDIEFVLILLLNVLDTSKQKELILQAAQSLDRTEQMELLKKCTRYSNIGNFIATELNMNLAP